MGPSAENGLCTVLVNGSKYKCGASDTVVVVTLVVVVGVVVCVVRVCVERVFRVLC